MQNLPPLQSRRRTQKRPARAQKERKNNANTTLIILGLTLFCAVIAAGGLFYYVITTSPDGTFDLEQLLSANPAAPAAVPTAMSAEASAASQAEAVAAATSPEAGFTFPPEFTKTPTFAPTLTFTPADTPEPSSTPIPSETIALWTQVPTATFDPNATATFAPLPSETPKITATPNCNITTSSSLFFDDLIASYELTNNGDNVVTIIAISIDWDTDNVRLNDVSFGGSLLWNTGDLTAPTEITGNWSRSEVARQLESGETKLIAFRFQNEPAQTNYSINVTFDNGCISGHSIQSMQRGLNMSMCFHRKRQASVAANAVRVWSKLHTLSQP